MSTLIEWSDESWNPIRARRVGDGKVGWWCAKVSEACKFCYSEKQNVVAGNNPGRFGNGVRYALDQQVKVEIFLHEDTLSKPLSWRKGKKIFPCSMTDLYGDWVPDSWLDQMYAVMALTPQHFYIVLTKRSERRLGYLSNPQTPVRIARAMEREIPDNLDHYESEGLAAGAVPINKGTHKNSYPLFPEQWPISNVIEMGSFGTQEEADKIIPILLQTPAAARGLSVEPMLEAISLEELPNVSGIGRYLNCLSNAGVDHGAEIPTKIDWVICGGESGPGARPLNLAWPESLLQQCQAADVPFFFKQFGSNPQVNYQRWLTSDLSRGGSPESISIHLKQGAENVRIALRDRKGGDPSEWPEHLRVREWPKTQNLVNA
jgi:protein gp37